MKIWLDDERPIPESYDTFCHTALDAIQHLLTGYVTDISLDHDLGYMAGTGQDVADFIEKMAFCDVIPELNWDVHSANPVGCKNMMKALMRADMYWQAHKLTKKDEDRIACIGQYIDRWKEAVNSSRVSATDHVMSDLDFLLNLVDTGRSKKLLATEG